MKVATVILLSASMFCLKSVAGNETTDMAPYPAPENGFQRFAFRVPAADQETERKVEIIVGKMLSIDCNVISFVGMLETRVAVGWSYPYYVIEKVSGPMSTRMACPPGSENTESFVTVNGAGFLQRYNSKLPVVVYVPQGFEVRYRVWAAQQDIGKAEPE